MRPLRQRFALFMASAFVAGCVAAQPALAQGQVVDPPRPAAQSVSEDMMFRENDRIVGRISIPDARLSTLEQPQGRAWRMFHEGWAPWIAGLALLFALLGVVAVHLLRGVDRYPRGSAAVRDGGFVMRYSWFERFNHWMTATSFVVLALTGLNYVFGKRLLMPLMGPETFGAFSQWAKFAHNFVALPFVLGVLTMVVVWSRDNLPRQVDRAWLSGGLVGARRHVSAGRFNAGQKLLYWGVVLLTLVMLASGALLLFPLYLVDVNGMQIASGAHLVAAAIFMMVIVGHIYIGTLGTEGAFRGMGTGDVDVAWARHHHDLWVDEAARRTGQERASAQPARGGFAMWRRRGETAS